MISCSCDMEPATLYSANKRKANRLHHCNDCGGKILPGERYTRIAMLFDGRWTTDRRCADCQFVIHEVERTFMEKCGGAWCVYVGELAMSFDDLCEGAERSDAPQLARIVGMQNAVAKARGGTKLFSLPLWLQPDDEPKEEPCPTH